MAIIQFRQPPDDAWVAFLVPNTPAGWDTGPNVATQVFVSTASNTGLWAVTTVNNLTELAALDVTGWPSGWLVYVKSLKCNWLLRQSTAAVVTGEVINAITAGCQWWRQVSGNEYSNPWVDTPNWYVNETTGNDEATGADSTHPIKTISELQLRLLGGRINQLTQVYLQSNLTKCHLSINVGSNGQLIINGSPAVVDTGVSYTVNSYTAPAGNEGAILKVNGIDFTGYVGKRIRFTSGPCSKGWCWIHKVNPAGGGTDTARITIPYVDDVTANGHFGFNGVPAAGNTLVVETSLPQVKEYSMALYGYPDATVNSESSGIAHCQVYNAVAGYLPLYNEANVIQGEYFYGCEIIAPQINGKLLFLMACRIPDTNCTVYSSAESNFGIQIWNCSMGDIKFANVECFYSLAKSITAVIGNTILFQVGIFDSSGDAFATNNENGTVTFTGLVYGNNNTGYGLRTKTARLIQYASTKPTVTGSAGDTIIAGVAKAYAAIPFFDNSSATGPSGIVNSA